MLECVANVSEGRDTGVLGLLADACGGPLLDLHVDADHHRSVFTLVSPQPGSVENAARLLAAAVARHVDVSRHEGVHPRMGALDVVPFVSLDGTDPRLAVEAAVAFGRWWSEEFSTPVFLYDDASPDGVGLPAVRRSAFRDRAPDLGPARPSSCLGATAVGARRVLVAINCELASSDVEVARRIARGARESSGGLRGVRALGLRLASREAVQVSMNLTDLPSTGVEQAVTLVRDLAGSEGEEIARVELVGLLPRAELARCSPEFLVWAGLEDSSTIEARLARPRSRWSL